MKQKESGSRMGQKESQTAAGSGAGSALSGFSQDSELEDEKSMLNAPTGSSFSNVRLILIQLFRNKRY